MLFAADLLAQFAKTLKLKAVPFQTLLRFLEGDASQEESSDAIWEVYQNLLAIAVQVNPFHSRSYLMLVSISG